MNGTIRVRLPGDAAAIDDARARFDRLATRLESGIAEIASELTVRERESLWRAVEPARIEIERARTALANVG